MNITKQWNCLTCNKPIPTGLNMEVIGRYIVEDGKVTMTGAWCNITCCKTMLSSSTESK